MKVELKKFTSNARLSEETICFSADLYVDGKKIGECSNRGHGDPILINYFDAEAGRAFEEYCKSLPPTPWPEDFPQNLPPHPMDAEGVIDGLVEDILRMKQYKSWCKNKTVVRLKGAKEGEWLIHKMPYSPQAKQAILARYGDKIEEILNETLLQPV